MAKKYYAVKSGRAPGIYDSWEACKAQVHGFPSAIYKSFSSSEEALNFMESANRKIPNEDLHVENTYRIYVDGSYSNARYSWGFAAYIGKKLIYKDCGIGRSKAAAQLHNVAGELEAVKQAVIWAKQENINCITIVHDYIGISEWAEGRWKTNNEITKDYAAFMRLELSWIRFEKVSGHTGVEGNELADQLAKSALGIK